MESLQARLRQARDAQRRELGEEVDRATDAFQAQLRQGLDDPDPAVREQSLGEIELGAGDTRERIVELGEDDPSPRVRIAAAETLGDDGTFQAVADLLGMLDDPEPDVLLATLEALDQSADESIEPYVAPLSKHPDAQVREKANEMLEFWED
jgi:HEAT repeat protein